MSTEDRLKRLERELLARMGRTRWLLVALGVVVVGAGLAWTVANTTATAQAQGPTNGPKAIRANQFVLVDETGKPRVVLDVDKVGPFLDLLDENGKVIWSQP
ncbi:MAG TPA: hypothetical protein VLM91_02100 [Candidatus Methylomirabilis sp.]|nr:hypothetical protein [Candidatus Methylomirabilis sp.]